MGVRKKRKVDNPTIQRTFKYRIYPTKGQIVILEGILWHLRTVYNDALTEKNKYWQESRKNISYYDQSRRYTIEKRLGNYSELPPITRSSAIGILQRLDEAFIRFMKGDKNKKRSGHPKFKGRRSFNTIPFPTHGNGIKFHGTYVYIQYANNVKVKYHRPIKGEVRNCNIVHKNDKWYITVTCEIPFVAPPKSINPKVGIDVGLKNMIATSDGKLIVPPKWFRQAESKLRRLNRACSRKERFAKLEKRPYSNRWRKARKRANKFLEHIAQQRGDFLHKLSRDFVNTYGEIGLENLNLSSMIKGSNLGKGFSDVAIGRFRELLTYKAVETGTTIVKVSAYNTTQICSKCGRKQPKHIGLNVRVIKCAYDDCDYEENRDINSAVTVEKRMDSGSGRDLHAIT